MRLIQDYLWGILTVWQEARGESYQGMRAVAEVIQRRAKKKYMSDGTVAGTVLRDRQFSGWNAADPNRIKAAVLDTSDPTVSECVRAWLDAERGDDIVPGACHYFNANLVSPPWAKGADVVAVIGNHTFVKGVK